MKPSFKSHLTRRRNTYLNRSIFAIQISQTYGINAFDAAPVEEDAESAHVSSHIDQRLVSQQLDQISDKC